jgi:hypothetical protein
VGHRLFSEWMSYGKNKARHQEKLRDFFERVLTLDAGELSPQALLAQFPTSHPMAWRAQRR